MKKINLKLTIILSILLLALIPMSVNAATSGTCGDNLTWVLDNNGTLTISGKGDMHEFSSGYGMYPPWYSSMMNIKSINIENGVTSIGSSAFEYCENLESVTIPDSVITIGNSAFNGCYSLEDVYITDLSAWCKITFADYASNPFVSGCNLYLNGELVTDAIIPNDVTSISSHAFSNCRSITSVTIPNSVTSIGDSAFSDCWNLKSVNIPDSIMSIGDYAFSNCLRLTSISIPNRVTNIEDSTFFSCYDLTSIIIPNSVTNIDREAFQHCSDLTIIKYTGSKEQWNEISIDQYGNADLLNAKIIYNYDPSRTTGIKVIKVDNDFIVTPTNAPTESSIIFVCYNNRHMVYFEPFAYTGEENKTFTPDKKYDTVKVLVWENLETLIPLCKAEKVPLN